MGKTLDERALDYELLAMNGDAPGTYADCFKAGWNECQAENDARIKALEEKLRIAVEFANSIEPSLKELSKFLLNSGHKNSSAEHDAILIACGFLKVDRDKFLAKIKGEG